jgi:hypothetical protein
MNFIWFFIIIYLNLSITFVYLCYVTEKQAFIKLFTAMTPLVITSLTIISAIMLISSKKFKKKVEITSARQKEMQA